MEETEDMIPEMPAMPGDLGGSVKIQIHTKHGWRLIYSRKSDGTPSPMIGLFRFAKRMGVLWTASEQDDPFADYYMDLVHSNIEATIHDFEERQRMLDITFNREKQKGLEFELATSKEPIVIPLNFSNPYGYLGSRLIGKCDEFIRTTFTCRHVGILSYDKNEQNVRWAMKSVLRAFDTQRPFRLTGVTREDYRTQSDLWRKAVEAMETPSSDILQGRRAKVSPAPKQPTEESAEPMDAAA